MTPWHDCAPSHSRPDGAVVAGSTHRATHRPRQLAPTRSARDTSCLPLIDPAPMAARPPSSCQCGCLTPPSSPSIGIWPGPFAFPYPSSLVSTTGRPRFGGFGFRKPGSTKGFSIIRALGYRISPVKRWCGPLRRTCWVMLRRAQDEWVWRWRMLGMAVPLGQAVMLVVRW